MKTAIFFFIAAAGLCGTAGATTVAPASSAIVAVTSSSIVRDSVPLNSTADFQMLRDQLGALQSNDRARNQGYAAQLAAIGTGG